MALTRNKKTQKNRTMRDNSYREDTEPSQDVRGRKGNAYSESADENIDYDKRLRNYRNRRLLIILGAVAAVIIAIVIICLAQHKSSYSSYSVEKSNRREDVGTAEYIYVGENMYRCSKDGVAAFDNEGEPLWNASYEVGNPYIAAGGQYFAVADLNGNNVHLFNAEGDLGSINSAMPILQVCVSPAGYVAIVVGDDGADYIHMYQMEDDHDKIYTIKKSISIDGLPVCVAISPDGQKLVCAYTGVSEGGMDTQLVFSNFDEVGQNENERVVGGFDYGDELIGSIQFLDRTTVAAFGENSLNFYRIKEYPEELSRVEVDYRILSIFSSDNYVGMIHRDSENGEKVLEVYNTDGNLLMQWTIPYDDLSSFCFKDNMVVAYGDKHCVIVNFSKTELFNYVFEEGIVDLFPIDSEMKFVYINTNYVQKIRLE